MAVQGQGLIGIATTAAATHTTWVTQANAYVDLAAGVIAVIAGCLTIAWYVTRFYKLRGGANDKTDTS